jgi:hypothetical protein
MSQYPLDTKTDLVEAVNYLLSGPGSLGQNFEGISAVGVDPVISSDLLYIPVQTYLTGMPMVGSGGIANATYGSVDYPADPLDPSKYYPIWNTIPSEFLITAITPVTATGHRIEISVTLGTFPDQSQLPFANDQQVVLSGVTPSSYDGTYTVVDYNADDFMSGFIVTLYSEAPQTWATYTSGGQASINDDFTGFKKQRFFTGNQSVVSVSGPTDRVFISSQMNDLIAYTYTRYVGIANYVPKLQLEINRYKAVESTTLPDVGTQAIYANATNSGGTYAGFNWSFDANLVSVAKYAGSTSIGFQIDANDLGDVIYNNIIDNPGIGVYLYAFQITMDAYREGNDPADDAVLLVGAQTTGVRSFTAQVIKQ